MSDEIGTTYTQSDYQKGAAIADAFINRGAVGVGGGGLTQAQAKAAIESATNLDDIESSLGGISDNLGLTTDAVAPTATGTASLIGLIKFLNSTLESVQALEDVLPDPSDRALVASLRDPIFLPSKVGIVGFLSVASTNTNLLNGTGNGTATDISSWQSGELTVVSTATTGSYIVQTAFDLGFTIGVTTLQMFEVTTQNANPVNAAITPTVSTRKFALNLQGANFLRINMTTGAANVRPYLVVNQAPFVPFQTNVQQATGTNLNAAVVSLPTLTTVTTLGSITNLGISTFALTPFRNTALVATAVQIKAGAGRVHGINVHNPNASVSYIKFYAALSASVAVGVTIPAKVFAIPANGNLQLVPSLLAIVNLATGVTIAAVTGVADSSNTAPATGLLVEIDFV